MYFLQQFVAVHIKTNQQTNYFNLFAWVHRSSRVVSLQTLLCSKSGLQSVF